MPQLRQDLAAVVVCVAEGDRAELLSGASSVKLYGIVQRILGRQNWADAVLEDVYGRVWQRADDCDGASGSSDAWPDGRLATLARNLALDHIRRPWASPENLPSSLRETGIAWSAQQSEGLGRLSASLDAPSEGRAIVLGAYHYGLTGEQISRRVVRAEATVKSSLRRSLAQLRECLGR